MNNWQGIEFALQDELVIYRPECDKLFVLNDSASVIWQVWRSHEKVEEISRLLAEKYDAPIARLRSDIEQTIGQWRNEGLIGDVTVAEEKLHQAHAPVEFTPATTAALPADWYSRRYYRLHDFTILMQFADAGLVKAIHPLFAHLETRACANPATCFDLVATESQYQLQVKSQTIVSTGSLDMLAMGVFRESALRAYRERDTLLVIHGAAIADAEQAIVMPGAGGSGKSTLTAALLREGLTYLSDDVVPIDRQSGQAVPLPISLNLKAGSLKVLKLTSGAKNLHQCTHDKHQVWYFQPPGHSTRPPRGNYPILCLVFPRYRAGFKTSLRELTTGQALQQLVESQSHLRQQKDARYIADLLDWLGEIPAYSLEYDSLQEATDTVQSLLRTEDSGSEISYG